jgi:hypothetical protein
MIRYDFNHGYAEESSASLDDADCEYQSQFGDWVRYKDIISIIMEFENKITDIENQLWDCQAKSDN